MPALADASPAEAAEAWLAADPDPDTRAELRALLGGDPDELARRFSGRLGFGTAGIRGRLGAGPMRMNRVLVRIVASALAERVLQEGDGAPRVVISYDARRLSAEFAADTARVMAARGVTATLLDGPLPTPVLAFAVAHLDASAGVMVTASHNPIGDNGVKVYWRSGAQLAAPVDGEISRIIARTAPLAESALAPRHHHLLTTADDEIVESYLEAISALVSPDGPRRIRIAYTPLHGVGLATLRRALQRAGFDEPVVVAEQAEPDGSFPTTPFPNPEEPGVMDPVVRLAAETGADLALAHDPDADRLAVAVPDGEQGGWRVLTGDETGCMLADDLLSRAAAASARSTSPGDGEQARRRLVINTVVSSRLLGEIAAHHGADWVQTLTGFKWIMQAASQRADTHDLVLAYEDALGYAAGCAVLDKDGISAALVIAEMAAGAAAEGRTVADLLDDLHRRHGVYATGQRSIRFDTESSGPPPQATAMANLRGALPASIAGAPVTAVIDLAEGVHGLPPSNVVIIECDPSADRVIVRPSGTEAKLKIYAEAVVEVDGESSDCVRAARAHAQARAAELLDAAVGLVTR